MKTSTLFYILIITFLIISCWDDDDPKSGQAQITKLSIMDKTAVINHDNKTINLKLPYGSNLSNLSPSIEISKYASIEPPIDTPQDFNIPVTYIITAENGDQVKYTITVGFEPNTEAKIKLFNFGKDTLRIEGQQIYYSVPFGTDVSSLAPSIELSYGATISPKSGEKQDFRTPVKYMVTAENGNKALYYAVVKINPSNQAAIKSVTINGVKIESISDKIIHTVEHGTDLSNIAPVIEISNGASINPKSGEKQNFNTPVIYLVTAEDGKTQNVYMLDLKIANSSEAFIKNIKLGELNQEVTNQTELSLKMPYGTDLTKLAPEFSLSKGASLSPASGSIQNFTNPISYTVTSQDGKNKKTYTLSVVLGKSSFANILSFKENTNEYKIEDNIISFNYPYGYDISNLIPTISISSDASVDPKSGVAQNFSSPITYTVTAQDGTKKTYTAKVYVGASSEAEILSFKEGANNYSIEGTNISYTYPYATDVSNLTPTISISPDASVNPPSGVAQNFINPITYTVTAQDGTKKTYTVTVSFDKNTENDILSFKEGENSYTINGSKIEFTYPSGTDVTKISPTILVSSEATVLPQSGVEQDFTNPVEYTVTAENGTQKTYTVEAIVAKSSEANVLSFLQRINYYKISGTDITFTYRYGSDVSALTPVLELSPGATVNPASGSAQDFRNPVKYTVTAEDGTQKVYTVKVSFYANKKAEITSFSINHHNFSTTISGSYITIYCYTDPIDKTFTPEIEISPEATIDPPSGKAQDFSKDLEYFVRAQAGNLVKYFVTTKFRSDDATIYSFKLNAQEFQYYYDGTNNSFSYEFPFGTDLTNLTPEVSIHEMANIDPPIDTPQDFSKPVKYTVIAQNGDTEEYTIKASVKVSSEAKITSFTIPDQDIDLRSEGTMIHFIPNGGYVDLKSIKPVIEVSPGATVEPASGVEQDFSPINNPGGPPSNKTIYYEVTAADGVTKTKYRVSYSNSAIGIAENGVTMRIHPLFLSDYTVGQQVELYGETYTIADRDMLVQAINSGETYWLGKYITSKVVDMSSLFKYKSYMSTPNIESWDVSNVTNMSSMFENAKRMAPNLMAWDVSKVTDMSGMFDYAEWFDSDISHWDVSSVTSMDLMFNGATSFSYDLDNWCVKNLAEPTFFSESSATWKKPIWGTCPE